MWCIFIEDSPAVNDFDVV